MTELKNFQFDPIKTDFLTLNPEAAEAVAAGRWLLDCMQMHSFHGYFINDFEAQMGLPERTLAELSELDPYELDKFFGQDRFRFTARLDVTLLEGDVIALHKLFEGKDCFADNLDSDAVRVLMEGINGPASNFEVLYQTYLVNSVNRVAAYHDPAPVYASDPATYRYSYIKKSILKRMIEEFPAEVKNFLRESYSPNGLFTPGINPQFERLNVFNPNDVVFIVDTEPFVTSRFHLAYLLRERYLSSVSLAEAPEGLLRAYRPEDLLGPCWISPDLHVVITPPSGVDLKLFSSQLLQFAELHFNSEHTTLNSGSLPSLMSLDGLRGMIEVFPLAVKSIEALSA